MGEPRVRSISEGRILIEADIPWMKETLTAAFNYEGLYLDANPDTDVELASKMAHRRAETLALLENIEKTIKG